MSLVVVLAALPARLVAVPSRDLAPHWPVVVNLLAGSLVGAWAGASWATRMRDRHPHRVLAGLLVLMAAALVWTHLRRPPQPRPARQLPGRRRCRRRASPSASSRP